MLSYCKEWWPGTESVADTVLITRKLLILQTDKKDKTATKPIPLYVYCTVIFLEDSSIALAAEETPLLRFN